MLTIDEIRDGLSGVGNESYEEVKKIISSIDTDGSGKIDYTGNLFFIPECLRSSLLRIEPKRERARARVWFIANILQQCSEGHAGCNPGLSRVV